MSIRQVRDGDPGEEIGRREREPHHDPHLAVVEGEVAPDVVHEHRDDGAVADVEDRDEKEQEEDVVDVASAVRARCRRGIHARRAASIGWKIGRRAWAFI